MTVHIWRDERGFCVSARVGGARIVRDAVFQRLAAAARHANDLSAELHAPVVIGS
jgi:hypothetical protein